MSPPHSHPDTESDRWSDDKVLVAALIAHDEDAWGHVMKDMVLPLVRADVRGVRSQCANLGISEDAIASRLYVNLSKNDSATLRSFRFGCAFRSWVFWHVWDSAKGAIREVSEKIDVDVSEDGDLTALTDTKTPAPDRALASGEVQEGLNRLLLALWRENPVRAVVLLLRGELELSSKDVGAFLGKEPSNVDQIHHRAQAAMRRLRSQNDADF